MAMDLRRAHPSQVRGLCRSGSMTEPTTGLCLGYLQANLVILPSEAAGEFTEFCLLNPRPMPLVDVCEPGDPTPRLVAPEADLRTDLPRYRVYRDGELAEEPTDIRGLWRDDLVAFLLGCSFTAEAKLLEAGVRLRHWEHGGNVAMFVTTVQCRPSGRFHGPMVVSMRAIERDSVETAQRVTSEYPLAHGSPLQVGDPAAIGIRDLARPDYGDVMDLAPTEVPVFWACGVTPQAVIASVKPEFAITHAPGHMFITDVTDAEVRRRDPLARGSSGMRWPRRRR